MIRSAALLLENWTHSFGVPNICFVGNHISRIVRRQLSHCRYHIELFTWFYGSVFRLTPKIYPVHIRGWKNKAGQSWCKLTTIRRLLQLELDLNLKRPLWWEGSGSLGYPLMPRRRLLWFQGFSHKYFSYSFSVKKIPSSKSVFRTGWSYCLNVVFVQY